MITEELEGKAFRSGAESTQLDTKGTQWQSMAAIGG